MSSRLLFLDECFVNQPSVQRNQFLFKFHVLILTIVWAGIFNIGSLATLFRASIRGYYCHAIMMWIVTIFTFVGCLIQITAQSAAINDELHKIAGRIVLAITLVISMSGIWLRHAQESHSVSGKIVLYSHRFHFLLGLSLYFTAQLALLSAWWKHDKKVFYGLLIYQSIFFLIKSFFRFLTPKIEAYGVYHNTDHKVQNEIKLIHSKEELKKYSTNYCIFSDYVYSLEPVYGNHPGGYQLIAHIRTRQIDRFIYGMETLQINNTVPRFSHSKWAMNLAGQPLAKFHRTNPYSGMEEENYCKILNLCRLSADSSVYLLELGKKEGDKFVYKGFKNVSQLGQYFTVTINNCKSRLYTSVNCMNFSNRILMEEISLMRQDLGESLVKKKEDSNATMVELNENMPENHQNHFLPLLIKKYDDGYFTSEFISSNFNAAIKVSCAKGEGLALQEKKIGKVIILAGGTGIYPFIDTIDILYKKTLVDQNHSMKKRILEMDPAVADPCLDNFRFLIYASFTNHSDLHPMTLYQINELTQMLPAFKFTCYIKLGDKDKKEEFSKVYKGLRMSEQRFEEFLGNQLVPRQIDSISQVYMCGPSKMIACLLEVLENREVTNEKYTII